MDSDICIEISLMNRDCIHVGGHLFSLTALFHFIFLSMFYFYFLLSSVHKVAEFSTARILKRLVNNGGKGEKWTWLITMVDQSMITLNEQSYAQKKTS